MIAGSPTPARLDRHGPGPVLVLRALGLGDLLTAVPALRGLKRAVTPRPVLLAAPGHPGGVARWLVDLRVVDAVVPTADLDDEPPGRGLGPHEAVDLHGNGAPSRDLLAAAAPATLLSYAPPGVPECPWKPGEHEVRRWCRLLAAAGVASRTSDLRLDVPRVPHGAVVLHPGAAFASRRWPVERWHAVAAALAEQHEVVVTAGRGERPLAQRVADGVARARVVEGLAVAELAELLGGARLLICGDTGVAHLTTALGTPSVLLFGPVAPSAWGPAVDCDRHVVLWHGDGTGDPHGAEVDPHLLLTTVDEVLAAAQRLLGAHAI